MCMAIPGQIESIDTDGASTKGSVRFGSDDVKQVELAMLPDVVVGDYVIVHSGFAIRKVATHHAEEAFDLWSG